MKINRFEAFGLNEAAEGKKKVGFLPFADYKVFKKQEFKDMWADAITADPTLLPTLEELWKNCNVELYMPTDDMDLMAKAIKKTKFPYLYMFTEDDGFYLISSTYNDLLNKVDKPESR